MLVKPKNAVVFYVFTEKAEAAEVFLRASNVEMIGSADVKTMTRAGFMDHKVSLKRYQVLIPQGVDQSKFVYEILAQGMILYDRRWVFYLPEEDARSIEFMIGFEDGKEGHVPRQATEKYLDGYLTGSREYR